MTCTAASHEAAIAEAIAALDENRPANTPAAASLVKTMRHWRGYNLTVGECFCRGTLTIIDHNPPEEP